MQRVVIQPPQHGCIFHPTATLTIWLLVPAFLQGAEFAELVDSTPASSTIEDLLLLEAAVWAQLDTLIALASRVKGTRHTLPFGLLQLRPAPVQPNSMLQYKAPTSQSSKPGAADVATSKSVAEISSNNSSDNSSSSGSGNSIQAPQAGSLQSGMQPPLAAEQVFDDKSNDKSDDATTAGSSSSSSSRSSSGLEPQQQGLGAAQYAYAASEGCDAHADPLWPPLRRTARLSWAAASVVGQMKQDAKSEARQALLEATSVAQRLRYVLAVLGKHIKVLAAVAAVKSVQNEQ
jgi:hypothetical protein